MSSVNGKPRANPLEQCVAEKKRYDSCFKHWYHTKFLKVSDYTPLNVICPIAMESDDLEGSSGDIC